MTGGSGIVGLATSAHMGFPSRVRAAEGFRIRTMICYAIARLKYFPLRQRLFISLLEICTII